MIPRRLSGLALAAAIAGAAMASAGEAAAQTYDGLKKTVSVDQFQAAEAVGGTVTADGLTAMLTEALVKDGRFVVVERPGLASIQSEQALGTATGTTTETAAKTNQMIGSSAIVRGAVVKFAPAAGGSSLGIGGLPLGRLFGAEAGVKSEHATLEITLRLIDTTTGQVISTSSAEGTASTSGADVGLTQRKSGASITADTFESMPIGQAAQEAIVKAVAQIADGMRKVPWSAQVIEVSGGKVYLNAGATRNMQAGMVLTAYRKGKVLTDPTTNEVLDVEMQRLGTIRIDTVREKVSLATVVDGKAPARGDILKSD